MKKMQYAWKRWIILPGMAVFALAAAACAKPAAPAAPAMQLDMAQMLETAAAPAEAADTANPAEPPAARMRQRLCAPEHVRDSFESKDGKRIVEIDADVYVPNATKLSIIEVMRSPLTQDRADRVANALVKGQLMAYDTSLERCIGSAEVQHWIEAIDELIADQGASADGAWKAEMQAERDYWASVLENATGDTAPITSRLTHPAWRGKADGNVGYRMDKDDSLQLCGVAKSDAGCETLRVWWGTDQSCIIHYVREPNGWVGPGAQIGSYKSEQELALEERMGYGNPFGDIRASDVPGIPEIQTTRQQALEMGDALMRVLDIRDVSCVDAVKCWGGSFDHDAAGPRGISMAGYGITNPFRCVWRLRYTRTFNGMETTYDTNQCQPYIDPDDEKEVLPAADYESIEVYIDDTGVVGFRWAAPLDVGNVVVADAAVLPFDEIMRVFMGTFLSASRWEHVAHDAERRYEISGIRFGYTRIREQGMYDKGLLIPAWDFYASRIYEPGNDAGEIPCRPDESIFTINAIDGSIIDRRQGY